MEERTTSIMTFGEIGTECPKQPMYEFPCIVCGARTTQICNLCVESVCSWEVMKKASFFQVPAACYIEHRDKCPVRTKGVTAE